MDKGDMQTNKKMEKTNNINNNSAKNATKSHLVLNGRAVD